jgi:hypothetical protein
MMSTLEVTAPIAVTVGKYLYAAVKKWWDTRDENEAVKKNEVTVANLVKETEDLRDKLESKDRKEISSDDVKLVKQKMVEVKSLSDTMKEDVTSLKAVAAWADGYLEGATGSDVEDLAEFYLYRLRFLIDRSEELMLKRKRKEELQELLVSIEVNVNRFIQAERKAKLRPTPDNKGAFADTEYTLKDTLEYARDTLRQLG